jgi:hypothetical protein
VISSAAMFCAHHSAIGGLISNVVDFSNVSSSFGTPELVANHLSYASTRSTTSTGSPLMGI